jgi:hypothetical protein
MRLGNGLSFNDYDRHLPPAWLADRKMHDEAINSSAIFNEEYCKKTFTRINPTIILTAYILIN